MASSVAAKPAWRRAGLQSPCPVVRLHLRTLDGGANRLATGTGWKPVEPPGLVGSTPTSSAVNIYRSVLLGEHAVSKAAAQGSNPCAPASIVDVSRRPPHHWNELTKSKIQNPKSKSNLSWWCKGRASDPAKVQIQVRILAGILTAPSERAIPPRCSAEHRSECPSHQSAQWVHGRTIPRQCPCRPSLRRRDSSWHPQ